MCTGGEREREREREEREREGGGVRGGEYQEPLNHHVFIQEQGQQYELCNVNTLRHGSLLHTCGHFNTPVQQHRLRKLLCVAPFI